MQVLYDAVCFDLFGTLVDPDGRPAVGLHALLERIAGARWAVVTSCPRGLARGLLAQAGVREVPVVITADDVERNKPDPQGYRLAIARLGAHNALAVEDSAGGISAARGAGLDVVALLCGRDARFAREATYAVEALAQLRLCRHAQGVELTT